MKPWLLILACACGLGAAPERAAGGSPLALRDGDRVVLLGGTFIERSQRYGFLEEALTARFPESDVVFRNLGWSGDSVWAESRGIFDRPAAGYQRMIEQVKSLEPTLIVLAYGGNEAFAGEARLSAFLAQYRQLLADLEPTGARFCLITPTMLEDLGSSLPDPYPANADRRIYAQAIKRLGADKNIPVLDMFEVLIPQFGRERRLTDNTLHLTPFGYTQAAAALLQEAQLDVARAQHVSLTADGRLAGDSDPGSRIERFRRSDAGVSFRLIDDQLPLSVPKGAQGAAERRLQIDGLALGKYRVSIDGESFGVISAAEFASGVRLINPPEYEQAARLRRKIVEKNELYFHRWRPQNVTYLFLFRKHEQGQNAVEIPMFDPLVAEAEAEIARLRVPAPHEYRIERVKEAAP